MKSKAILFVILAVLLAPFLACAGQAKFEATPESLENYQVPEWYEDAKLGIYFHWAPFSVPAFITEWYPYGMYRPEDKKRKEIAEHHLKNWGSLDKFGYKDFIPMFKAEKWEPKKWVKLFKEAGGKYLVSAAIHHDGFAMWDSEHIAFNSADMGPKRDIVGEFMAAARKAGMKTGFSTHYGRHWKYYVFDPDYDTWDPKYEGLYGHRREADDPPRPEDEQHWENVMLELLDNYQPDYVFVDGGIGDGERQWKKPYFRQNFYNVLAHYYNQAQELGKDGVVMTYKREFLEPNQAVEDFERKGIDYIRTSSKWQTDDKISESGWCFVENTAFWPTDYLIAALVDTVSKGGNLLLNVGPRPDGTLREEEVSALKAMGAWLKRNGDAIYGTRPWTIFGEGSIQRPTVEDGAVRYTMKDGILYATCFGWPESGQFAIKTLGKNNPASNFEIKSIKMLGVRSRIKWERTAEALKLTFPKKKPGQYAYVLKITPKGKLPYSNADHI